MKSGGTLDLPRLCSVGPMALATLGLFSVLNWQSVGTFLVASDLQAYADTVRRSSAELADKEKLLTVIESMQDRLDAGQSPNWWRWCRHDRTIRQLLKGGFEEDEARLLERELVRANTKCWENNR